MDADLSLVSKTFYLSFHFDIYHISILLLYEGVDGCFLKLGNGA
jgi:hypothetical protein